MRSSTLDVGVCLLGKGPCCPGGVGTEESEVGCSSSVGARALRGVGRGPRDRAPQQQQQQRRGRAEDFRATDSGILAMRFDASIH
ncbi:unnamed protein product [Arctogadus glacialis]